MQLFSPAFKDGETIPVLYTCDGEEKSPPLEIRDVPKAAKSLVLIVDDPDVPKSVRSDQMWVHWIVFNISPQTTSISEGCVPKGVLGAGTRGLGYQGPCPPDREHRYFFKLYALDTMLEMKEGSTKGLLESAMQKHILATAQLIGRYTRRH
ncbi:MAG: YbhB/YbcL family Raf kinase inhibitor-like protein [Simkania sp.]|nr:YbhB/YbcL family Raf kinase inhibitor-like protein [Simkania sp.]